MNGIKIALIPGIGPLYALTLIIPFTYCNVKQPMRSEVPFDK